MCVLKVLADSAIFSIPGCEQPTMMISPSGVLIPRDNSRNSSVPGLSETSVTRRMSGAISVFLSINSKFASGQADPKRMVSGGVPL
jgi:hypothetical protein